MPLSQGHDRQSLSPAGLPRWYRLCAARVCQGDGHERAPWYAAHPPVLTPFSPATMAVNNDPEWLDTMRPLQKTGSSTQRRHGVHKHRGHQQREKARGTTTHGSDACGLFASSQTVAMRILGQRTGRTAIVFRTREDKDEGVPVREVHRSKTRFPWSRSSPVGDTSNSNFGSQEVLSLDPSLGASLASSFSP
jgi:hypothetical protein